MYPSLVKATDSFLGFTGTVGSFAKLAQISLPKPIQKVLKRADILKAIKLPRAGMKVWASKKPIELTHNLISLYFSAFSVRKAVGLVPRSELPFAAVLSLGSVDLFRRSLTNYWSLSANRETACCDSLDKAENFFRNLAKAKYDVFDSGLFMISSLSISARTFFPKSSFIVYTYHTSKLAAALLPYAFYYR